jgi:hypothetical protein
MCIIMRMCRHELLVTRSACNLFVFHCAIPAIGALVFCTPAARGADWCHFGRPISFLLQFRIWQSKDHYERVGNLMHVNYLCLSCKWSRNQDPFTINEKLSLVTPSKNWSIQRFYRRWTFWVRQHTWTFALLCTCYSQHHSTNKLYQVMQIPRTILMNECRSHHTQFKLMAF